MSEFGQWLKDEIKKAGWSSSSFAGAMGVPSQLMTDLYSGRVSVNADKAIKIGALLCVKPELLLYTQADHHLKEEKKTNTFKPDFSLKKAPNHPRRDAIVEMHKAGIEPMRIAVLLGVTKQHVYKTLSDNGVSVK